MKLHAKDGGWMLNSGGYVYIEPSVLTTLADYRQLNPHDPESGGLLTGLYAAEHIHVTDITTPQSMDSQGRTRFVRQDPFHVTSTERLYQLSQGLLNMVGEWHTHPQQIPAPSLIDQRSWQETVLARRPLTTIFLIQGTTDLWIGATSSGWPLRLRIGIKLSSFTPCL